MTLKMKMLDNSSAEMWIYGEIGGSGWGDGITSKQVADELGKYKDAKQINLRINSTGGDVFEGVAIYNQLRRHKAKVSVDIDGAALSIASIIAMAADPGELRMADNAFMMIHDPWSFTVGDSADHRKTAELLDGIKSQLVNTYVARTGMEPDQIAQMMSDETWMDAKSAESMKFIDSRTAELALAAHIDKRICRNIPDQFIHWQATAVKAMQNKTAQLKTELDKITSRILS